jgi:glycosyltransferase involved in cell wall biosynthesis
MKSNDKSTHNGPLRVLMVTGVYPTDRQPHAGTFIRTLVESLRAAGVEVEVLHPSPGPVLWRYLQTIRQVRRKAGTVDIIHGHYGQWCLFARLQWKTPVVAAFLGDDLLGTVLASGNYSKQGTVIAYLSRWLCRHVDMALVKSAEMQRASACPQTRIIPDGVDFQLFRPLPRAQMRAELGWRQQGYYILFANNPAIAVKHFPLARAACDHLAKLGVQAELVVANGLPQTELVRWINACDALILPSYAEGSPNVVKEAMACNVPVVATNVGDVSELISRTAGCRVCVPDPAALARGLLDALQYRQSTTGRADIAHLEASVIARQTLAIYHEILLPCTHADNLAKASSAL